MSSNSMNSFTSDCGKTRLNPVGYDKRVAPVFPPNIDFGLSHTKSKVSYSTGSQTSVVVLTRPSILPQDSQFIVSAQFVRDFQINNFSEYNLQSVLQYKTTRTLLLLWKLQCIMPDFNYVLLEQPLMEQQTYASLARTCTAFNLT